VRLARVFFQDSAFRTHRASAVAGAGAQFWTSLAASSLVLCRSSLVGDSVAGKKPCRRTTSDLTVAEIRPDQPVPASMQRDARQDHSACMIRSPSSGSSIIKRADSPAGSISLSTSLMAERRRRPAGLTVPDLFGTNSPDPLLHHDRGAVPTRIALRRARPLDQHYTCRERFPPWFRASPAHSGAANSPKSANASISPARKRWGTSARGGYRIVDISGRFIVNTGDSCLYCAISSGTGAVMHRL